MEGKGVECGGKGQHVGDDGVSDAVITPGTEADIHRLFLTRWGSGEWRGVGMRGEETLKRDGHGESEIGRVGGE